MDRTATGPVDGEIARILGGPEPVGVLGPAADWPAELRGVVDLLLGSPHPLVVCWGPELAFLYNDAFIPGAGDKHPAGLGQPVPEVWPEIWERIGPLLQRVMSTGESVGRRDDLLVMHRHGFPEETYWNYSYSPIRAADGRVLGVFNVTGETTRRVVGERRLRLLARLAEAGRDAATVEAALQEVGAVLDDAAPDVPCALLHRITEDGTPLLVAASGIDGAVPDVPVPTRSGVDVVEVPDGIPGCRSGVLPRTAASAVVPDAEGAPVAAILIGVPPGIPLDADQRAFLQLVVGHVRSAVTSARAAEAQRRRAEAIAEVARAKTEFFAGVSHEFRTPLALILGPLDSLRSAVPQDLRSEVDVLERNATRMLTLVNDLLDVARLEAGRVQGGFTPVDLAAVTAELAGLFRSAAERAGLALDVDCAPLPAEVWVDRGMWEKVVLNLLSNAVKHTFDGGIRVEVSSDGGHAVLRVEDTGTGIPAEDLPRLFDRFHRVRGARARSQEGSGIGLALVRQLVELHGGTVEVTSAVDAGSTFTVRLPFGAAHLPADALTPAADQPDRPPGAGAAPFLAEALRWGPADPGQVPGPALLPSNGGPPDRVLVADDNPDMRGYVARLLAERSQVQTVADGEQALAAALADPPDLIVSDVMMPTLDGLDLVRALRRDPRTAGVPVLLLSARAGEDESVEALAAGADDYLVKPFSARELTARASSHLQLGRVRRAAERRFRAMADATPALIWVDDPVGDRVFVNRGWLDFAGTDDPAAELGSAWQGRIHPQDRERYRSVRATAQQVGASFEVEYRLRHASGHHRWVLDRGAPVGDPGRPSGYVGGCLDIDGHHRDQRRHRLYAAVATALDQERTAAGRLQTFARVLVAHAVADVVRLHETVEGGMSAVSAVAAADPDREALLWSWTGDAATRRAVLATGEPRLLELDPADELGLRSGAVAPLSAGGRVLGLVSVGRTAAWPPYDAEDLELVTELGRRAGVAVDNARLLEQERASSERLALLHRATAQMSAAAAPEEVAAIAADHLALLLGGPVVGVWAAGATGPLRLLATHGWSDRIPHTWETLPRSADMPAVEAFRERRPLWLPDEAAWRARRPEVRASMEAAGMVGVGLLPLLVRGRCLGVIGVGFPGAHAFPAAERSAALAAAELAAQALDRSDLFQAETTARRAAERLGAVATALSRAIDLDAVAAVTVTHGRAATQAAAAVVLGVGPAGQLQPMATDGPGYEGDEHAGGELAADADHPLAHAVRTGEPVWSAGADQGVHPVHTALPLLVGGRAIGALGLRFVDPPEFDAQRRTVVLTLAGQCAQAVARARLHQAEHEVAVTLQRSLLPQRLPDLARLALATRYVPGTEGTEAGGDWFDVLELGDDGSDRVALVVGDVVGRGPAAAAVMGQLRSALAANLVNGQSPAGALEQLDLFARRIDGARASTVACAVIDTATGELHYACAGHPPPMVAGSSGVRLLTEGRGTPLGVTGRPPFAEAVDRIEPGSTILLCSDGLFERRDEVVDDGLDRLARAVDELPGRPDEVADPLLDRMLAGRSAPDDVAFVLARLLPGPLRLRLPAQPEQLMVLRRAVTEWSSAAGLGEDAFTDLQLALGEAVTNSIEHAYLGRGSRPVEVELQLEPDAAVRVAVADSGHWRPPPTDPGYRGRGLMLIRELAQDVAVEPGPEGTAVRFRLPPGGPSAGPPPAPPASAPPLPAPPGRAPDPAVPVTTRLRWWADGDAVRLRVDGDLDLAGVAVVRSELIAELGLGRAVTVALAEDCWVSSAGVALLSELAQRSTRPLRVATVAGSPARRMLALAGLDQVLELVEEPEA